MVVLGNVSGLFNLIFFVFLLTFLAAIFAAQIFRGELPQRDANGDVTNVTFSTIYNSFLGMYQVLSSENWTSVMYNVTSSTIEHRTAWIGAAFLILWFILANCKSPAPPIRYKSDVARSHRPQYVHCCHPREL